MFRPSLPPLEVDRDEDALVVGDGRRRERLTACERYGLTATAPAATALHCRKRRRENGCVEEVEARSSCAPRQGSSPGSASRSVSRLMNDQFVHAWVSARCGGEPRLELRARVRRRAVDAERVERVLHRVGHASSPSMSLERVADVVLPDDVARPVRRATTAATSSASTRSAASPRRSAARRAAGPCPPSTTAGSRRRR